ncbi:hypothetical protein, partial [Salmonella enterica]|uniref:hypothetical protein n=1 Tax=Salmonella enterica TaxID=28901 RepID=UPI003CFB9C8F
LHSICKLLARAQVSVPEWAHPLYNIFGDKTIGVENAMETHLTFIWEFNHKSYFYVHYVIK